jgi:hypothetical protein
VRIGIFTQTAPVLVIAYERSSLPERILGFIEVVAAIAATVYLSRRPRP